MTAVRPPGWTDEALRPRQAPARSLEFAARARSPAARRADGRRSRSSRRRPGSTSTSRTAPPVRASRRSTRPTGSRCARSETRRPQPPRDLWARTAAAIEQESGGRRPATSPSPRRDPGSRSVPCPGIAVIAVVIGVSTLSANLFVPQPSGRARGDRPAIHDRWRRRQRPGGVAQATPFAVGAGVVEWVDKTADGLALQQRRRG